MLGSAGNGLVRRGVTLTGGAVASVAAGRSATLTTRAARAVPVPAKPPVAVGTSQILEAVNVTIRCMTKTGGTPCTFNLNIFLGTSDALSDPWVQFDNVNNRYSLTVTVIPASGTATPALWVAASQANDACGGWFTFRVGFNGARSRQVR